MRVAVLSTDETVRSELRDSLKASGCSVALSPSGQGHIDWVRSITPGMVIIDSSARPDVSLISECLRLGNRPSVLLISGTAVQDGASVAAGLCALQTSQAEQPPRFIGLSAATVRIREMLPRVAASECNVLITGETGTGKELIAQEIHAVSSRRGKPLAAINCAAIPELLLESELFGHERGAFTGAYAARRGHFHDADGGTVFLDEIGEMDLRAQAKLLRLIETRQIQRLGSSTPVPVNVRLIAATNQNLEALVREGRFRSDLYYRLRVVSMNIAPLRERKEDVPLLAKGFVTQLSHKLKMAVEGFSHDAMSLLLRYDWPGNVRELRNLLEAVFVAGPGQWIEPADFPDYFLRDCSGAGAQGTSEKDLLISALESTHWNKSEAARQLQWSRMTLYRKMQKHHLSATARQANAGAADQPHLRESAASACAQGPRRSR